jgi:hypothetical protein
VCSGATAQKAGSVECAYARLLQVGEERSHHRGFCAHFDVPIDDSRMLEIDAGARATPSEVLFCLFLSRTKS